MCEKPNAAARVAQAIDEENVPRRLRSQGVTYFECGTKQGTVIVCSALGHLYSMASKDRSDRRLYPIWDARWRPKSEVGIAYARIGRWIRVISALAGNVDHFVNACDYDTEGSLIGYMVLKHACKAALSKSSRMVFSTMTEAELRQAFRHASPELGIPLVEAARCRHELDWLYGVNLSRMLTDSVLLGNGGYATLSTGRVQGPTLKFVVDREREIASFVPVPYWMIVADVLVDDRVHSVDYQIEKIQTRKQAEQIVDDCQGQILTVRSIDAEEVEQKPPYPFDLSGLQSEAFRHFGFSPSRTVSVAERLYLDALISYPRTGSQKLPPSIGYESIIRGLSAQEGFRQPALRLLQSPVLRPSQGLKDDPAHPSIYPTGQAPTRSLSQPEAKLYDLIVRRFLAAFAQPASHHNQRALLESGPHLFYLRGSRLEKEGWMEFYKPYASVENRELPSIRSGSSLPLVKVESREHYTQAAPRFSPLSLLRRMEEAGIGTKATRGEIVDILYRRGYLIESRIRATLLAATVVELLEKYCRLIIDADFTATVEVSMARIQESMTSRKLVLLESIQHLRAVMLELIKHEEVLGGQLANVLSHQRLLSYAFKTPCPDCGSALKIVRNSSTGKRFVGCAGYWKGNCRFTLPLPQIGNLAILDRSCKNCGFQMIQVRHRKGRYPLVSCPRCYATELGTRKDNKRYRDKTTRKAIVETVI